jgi:hypothetical protein
MKTKLLKKIRKRYTIIKIDELASNACNFYKDAKNEYGFPFFVLRDNKNNWELLSQCSKDFKEARENLCKWIISDYSEKFRHKDEVSSKVWWVNKKRNKF